MSKPKAPAIRRPASQTSPPEGHKAIYSIVDPIGGPELCFKVVPIAYHLTEVEFNTPDEAKKWYFKFMKDFSAARRLKVYKTKVTEIRQVK